MNFGHVYKCDISLTLLVFTEGNKHMLIYQNHYFYLFHTTGVRQSYTQTEILQQPR